MKLTTPILMSLADDGNAVAIAPIATALTTKYLISFIFLSLQPGRRPTWNGASPASLVLSSARQDRDENDHALHDLLVIGFDVEQIENVVDEREREHAADDASDRAAAAAENAAADDDGGDRVEFVADADARLGDAESARRATPRRTPPEIR